MQLSGTKGKMTSNKYIQQSTKLFNCFKTKGLVPFGFMQMQLLQQILVIQTTGWQSLLLCLQTFILTKVIHLLGVWNQIEKWNKRQKDWWVVTHLHKFWLWLFPVTQRWWGSSVKLNLPWSSHRKHFLCAEGLASKLVQQIFQSRQCFGIHKTTHNCSHLTSIHSFHLKCKAG